MVENIRPSQQPDNREEPTSHQFGAAPQPKSRVPAGRVTHMGPISRVEISTNPDEDINTRQPEAPSHPSMHEPNVKSRLQFLGDGTSVYTEERNDVAPVSPGTGGNVVRTEDGRIISDFASLSAASGMTAVLIGDKKMSLVEAQARGVLVRDERGQLRLAATSTVVPQPQTQQPQPPAAPPAAQGAPNVPTSPDAVEVPLSEANGATLSSIGGKIGVEGLLATMEEMHRSGGVVTDEVAGRLAERMGVEPSAMRNSLNALSSEFMAQTYQYLGFVSPQEQIAFNEYCESSPERRAKAVEARRAVIGRGAYGKAVTLLQEARSSGEMYSDAQIAEMLTGSGVETFVQDGMTMIRVNGKPTSVRAAFKSGVIRISRA